MDSLLCFLSSAKNDFSNETLHNTIEAFYSYEHIRTAKGVLCNLLSKETVWRRDPEKKKKELTDVIGYFEEFLSLKKKVRFVCDTYKGMPPVGFEFIVPIITNLCSEISKLNDFVPKILDIKSEVMNTADTVRQLRLDVNEIKTKFGNAISGLQTASETVQDDLDIISDLRSFRNSLGNINGAIGGMPDDLQDVSSVASTLRDDQRNSDRVTNKRQNSTEKGKVAANKQVSNALTGAIFKDALTLRGRKKVNDIENLPMMLSDVQQIPDDTMNSETGGTATDMDNEGWKTVQRRRNKFRVMGAKKENSSLVKAVRRTADVFIGRVDKDVRVGDIESYIKDVFGMSVEKTENIKIRSDHFIAFKVTVLLEDRDKLFNSELWPEGMVVNKFYNRRA